VAPGAGASVIGKSEVRREIPVGGEARGKGCVTPAHSLPFPGADAAAAAVGPGPGGGTVASVRILVVDDEVDLAEAIGRGLRREGYAVDLAFDGEDAIDKAEVNAYDLICLDITMPGIDGIEVCAKLRAHFTDGPGPRVLMLTARDSIDERIHGLDAGADDYLLKPFAFGELAARVRSLLRRDAGRGTAVLRVGPLELDTARHVAHRSGRELDLTAKEFALLRYFMARPGEVLSQEELLEHVWDEHADPFTNTVRVTVGTLRRKVTIDDEEPLLETVIGRGYRLRDESEAA
jgi:DNA-binding response OmpR family regulator